MTSVKIDQDELPEYLVRAPIVKIIETADGVDRFELLAPGHHPKLRVTDCRIVSLDPAVSVQMQAVLELGDGTDIYTALNTGTTDYEVVDGTRATTDNIVERHEGLYLNVTAAGTAALVLLVANTESIN